MKARKLPFRNTNSFSGLILDYLDGADTLKDFYDVYPSKAAFKQAAAERSFSKAQRDLLYDRLIAQYQEGKIKLKADSRTINQITALKEENTYTITTGHQLCLMGGPLYFIYKIASIIKLCSDLNELEKDLHFVPVFWMASEDHDFEEIDHFQFKGKSYRWERETEGAVGRMNTQGLQEVYNELQADLEPFSGHANRILQLFEKAYLKHDNLADATRQLVHELFAEEGLLILDGDDHHLKASFAPYMERELKENVTEEQVNLQSEALSKHYKLQVNPRAINLFYLTEKGRERIEKVQDGFQLVESEKHFDEAELFELLREKPEEFSPNVLMRPLYQEAILPNLAYIGGGGELAYWFQLNQSFEAFEVDFPMLILRNSALFLGQEELALQNDLGLSDEQLFMRKGDLLKQWVIEQDHEDLLLRTEKEQFKTLWEALKSKTLEKDAGLERYVDAQETKLQNWMDQLGNKLIRAERRQSEVAERKIEQLRKHIFPKRSLQERHDSFIQLMLIKGDDLIPELIEAFELPTDEFLILEV